VHHTGGYEAIYDDVSLSRADVYSKSAKKTKQDPYIDPISFSRFDRPITASSLSGWYLLILLAGYLRKQKDKKSSVIISIPICKGRSKY